MVARNSSLRVALRYRSNPAPWSAAIAKLLCWFMPALTLDRHRAWTLFQRILSLNCEPFFRRSSIRFFNNVVVIFEQRQNVFNSTLHVVEVMRAGHSARCLLELGVDEPQKAGDVGRKHGYALFGGCRGAACRLTSASVLQGRDRRLTRLVAIFVNRVRGLALAGPHPK